MAKEDENKLTEGGVLPPADEAPVAENPMEAAAATPAYGPNKTAARERLGAKYPDLDLDDEEGLYGAWNDEAAAADEEHSALEDYRAADERIGSAMAEDPLLAGLFQELLKKDKKDDPLLMLIDRYGDDFVELLNDPDNDEFRKRLADKHAADVAAQAEREKLEAESEANIDASLDALDKVCAEMGIDDSEKDEIYKSFISLCEDLTVDKVSEDVWRLLANGYRHDADVEQAGSEGEVRGRNTRIREQLADRHAAPQVGGGGGGRGVTTSRPEVKLGGALDEPRNAPWYER